MTSATLKISAASQVAGSHNSLESRVVQLTLYHTARLYSGCPLTEVCLATAAVQFVHTACAKNRVAPCETARTRINKSLSLRAARPHTSSRNGVCHKSR